MINFVEPEIKVVKFETEDVITTSGFNYNYDDHYVSDTFWKSNNVVGVEDGDFPL